MQDAFGRAVEAYKAHHGECPKRLVILRNGVGDSQFLEVGGKEVKAINDKLQQLCPDTKMCFLLTFKNTKARIFKTTGNDLHLENPIPGTVIDGQGISNSNGFYEFLLVPQNVRQGCSTPIKIVCLHNQVEGLCARSLHYLTFHLCHSFFNWFGTIKMPAPTEYAGRMAKFIGDHRTDYPILPQEGLSSGFYYL